MRKDQLKISKTCVCLNMFELRKYKVIEWLNVEEISKKICNRRINIDGKNALSSREEEQLDEIM
jgi:hypothetical protein